MLRFDLLQFFLGSYHTEAEAARAYDRASLVFFGMQGHTNVSLQLYCPIQSTTLLTERFKSACMLMPTIKHFAGLEYNGRLLLALRIVACGSLPSESKHAIIVACCCCCRHSSQHQTMLGSCQICLPQTRTQ